LDESKLTGKNENELIITNSDLKSVAVFYNLDYSTKKFSFLSDAVENLTGYSLKELNKINFSDLIVPESQMDDYNGKPSNDIDMKDRVLTYRILTKSGEEKLVEDSFIVLVNPKDQKKKRLGVLKDISQQINDDKINAIISEILEAADSERKLEDLFSFIHTQIKKLMKADNFYIAYYKKDSNLLTFPYFVDEEDTDSSAQLFGRGLTEFVLRTGKSALIDKKLDDELTARGEVELVGPQSEIWLGVPLKIKNKTIGVMVLQDYREISTYGEKEKEILDFISYPISRAIERKMVDEEKKEFINELQEMIELKDQLFSMISHDLRSPFNSLLGFSDVLLSDYDSLTQRDVKEYLKVINDSAKTLFAMTNNLLEYSRYQLGKYDFTPCFVNVNDLIKNNLEQFEDRLKRKDILIKKDIPDDLAIYADENMLNVILNNTLSNAVKYSRVSGTIFISASRISEEDDEAILVAVKDEGIGINKEDKKRITKREMFTTLGTSKEMGTGLGLLLVQDFMSECNGLLKILSEENKGTEVLMMLPAQTNKIVREQVISSVIV
jgi:PAS domain S-box-containing protein